jgi:hypothetical protein
MTFGSGASRNYGSQSSWYDKHGIKTILFVGVVVLLLLLGTCGRSAYYSYRRADSAVVRFHSQLDREEYEDAYGDATDEFRSTGARQQQIELFKTIHEKMGDSGKRSAKGFHITATFRGMFVSVVYRTEFASGPADEYFVWRMDQEQPKLWSYHIDSPYLR